MKKAILFSFISLLFHLSYSQAQRTFPKLSRQEMYSDYDTLISALTKINPHDFIRKKVNHYSQSDSIKVLRKRIDTMTSTTSFFWLVNTALNFCQDGHTSIRGKSTFSLIDSLDLLRWHASIKDTATIQAYRDYYNQTLASYKLNLPVKYLDGQYWVIVPFKYKGFTIPENSVIAFLNHQEIHHYINTHQGSIKNMHWDFVRKRFYSDNFYVDLVNNPRSNISLTFLLKKKSFTVDFNLSDTVVVGKPLKFEEKIIGKVKYFKEGEILYIRMPVMRDGDFYVSKIDSISKLYPISKVMLDVRDNAGGSDPEWIKVITHLIDKPIIRKMVSCGNIDNPRRDRWFDLPLPPLKPFQNSFINPTSYQLISDEPDTLLPDRNSLKFKNKIYILQNENCFSSTGDLISTSQFSDQLVNAGNSTGWFGGFGSMPWILLLPNSKISYWTEPRLDFTNVEKPEDLYHNQVKISIEPVQKDYIHKWTYPGDWYGDDYLLKLDRLFLAIKALNKPISVNSKISK